MAGSWTTRSINFNGTALTMRMWDESGSNTGPFSFAPLTPDGTTTVATVKAANTAATANDAAMVVTISPNGVNQNGRTSPANSAPVVLASQTYKSCAAASTTQCGSTGAAGDYLDGLLIIPGAAAAGIVQIQDASLGAMTVFAGGGTVALPTLAPFYVPIGALATGVGGWKVITNTSVTAIAIGNFT